MLPTFQLVFDDFVIIFIIFIIIIIVFAVSLVLCFAFEKLVFLLLLLLFLRFRWFCVLLLRSLYFYYYYYCFCGFVGFVFCFWETCIIKDKWRVTHIICADNFQSLLIWLRTKTFFSMEKSIYLLLLILFLNR